MIELLEKLKTQAPFSFLNENAFRRIEKSVQIAYYPEDTVLIKSGDIPHILFLIIKGTVEALNDDELIDMYHSSDLFGGIELIENQPSRYTYLASEELICYEIPKDTFLTLCEESGKFKAYFFSSIADRIDMLKEKKEFSLMSDLMVARIDESLYRRGSIVPSDMSIIEALMIMEQERSSCLVIENSEGFGIVTDANLRYYILNKEKEGLEQVFQIQTYPVISAGEGELLFNILLLMTEHSIKHLPIFDEADNYLGVLELIDLLSFFSNQSHLITVQMQKAQNLEDVIAAAKRVQTMIGTLHARGVKSRYIAKLVSEINKKMYTKLFEMVFPSSWQDRCCFILLGSEGRSEQILRTDQDNALILEDGFLPEDLQIVTRSFIEILDEIGFPRCPGNVMIINEKWCKTLHQYKESIDQWIDHPDYDGLMDMAIFFDSEAITGKVEFLEELKKYLIERVSGNKTILTHFARAIESFESPLGMFSQFVSSDKGHKNEIDIKKGALFALVHGARALALEYGTTVSNTTLRIKELNNIGFISKEDTKELMESLEVLNSFRLRSQLEKSAKGEEIDNYLSLGTLSKLERDLLKDALKTVNKFRKIVSYHFHLSLVG
ncbi:MAG: putative nucleotidyltransferase substrate binding domain-containing protein [Campylobacterota bacterium]|nr:putative nucleotidyltransferase substrate binding domain-containing protein [Campylobacterota bacterium]